MNRKTKRKTRIKLKPFNKLTAEVHALVSKYVRLRDGKCVLCGSKENLTAGHWTKRGKKVITYDLRNVNCLCRDCNFRDWKDSFYHDIYTQWMTKKYGQQVVDELIAKVLANQTYKFTRLELENLKIALDIELENLQIKKDNFGEIY